MPSIRRVFVSYTGEDLAAHARAVRDAINADGEYLAVDHKNWPAEDKRSVDACKERVRDCFALVVLVAHRYGWTPTEEEGGDGERSITWIEVDTARNRDIQVLGFLLEETASWPDELRDDPADAVAREGLARFRAELQSGIVKFFDKPEDLSLKVVQSLHNLERREASPDQRIEDYRDLLHRRSRRLRQSPRGGLPEVELPLDGVFVEPVLAPWRDGEATFGLRHLFTHTGEARIVLLTGPPGSGKSVALQYLARVAAESSQGPTRLGLRSGTAPVLLRLPRRLPRDDPRGMLPALLERSAGEIGAADDVPTALRGATHVLWLLDGLDRVEDDEQVAALMDQLAVFSDDRPGHRFLLATRITASPRGFERAVGFSLAPLDADRARDMTRRWFRAMAREEAAPSAAAGVIPESLDDALWSGVAAPDSAEIVACDDHPLLLSLLCARIHGGLSLPDGAPSYLDDCVDLLVDGWPQAEGRTPPAATNARSALAHAAWWLHQRPGRTSAPPEDLEPAITDGLAASGSTGVEPRDALRALVRETGALTAVDDGELAFLRPTLQNYLVAGHARTAGAAGHLVRHARDPWWHAPVVLSVGGDAGFAEAVARRFVAAGRVEEAPELAARCVEWAGGAWAAPLIAVLEDPRVPIARKRAILAVLEQRTDPDLLAVAARLVTTDDPGLAALARRLLDRARPAHGDGPAGGPMASHGIELVPAPAGVFSMGSLAGNPDERPVHEVELERFWIGSTPVTNAQYGRFLDHVPGTPAPDQDPRHGEPDLPVVGVSHRDARAFCAWAGLSLPTEAQWEYACRAGSRGLFWAGSAEDDVRGCGWTALDAGGCPHPVATREANPWSLFDVHGNVWEWCADRYGPYGADALREPYGPDEGGTRALRGGSYRSPPGQARSATRAAAPPGVRLPDVGFRVATATAPR